MPPSDHLWGVSRCACGEVRLHLDRVTLTFSEEEFLRLVELLAEARSRVLSQPAALDDLDRNGGVH